MSLVLPASDKSCPRFFEPARQINDFTLSGFDIAQAHRAHGLNLFFEQGAGPLDILPNLFLRLGLAVRMDITHLSFSTSRISSCMLWSSILPRSSKVNINWRMPSANSGSKSLSRDSLFRGVVDKVENFRHRTHTADLLACNWRISLRTLLISSMAPGDVLPSREMR